MGVEPSPRMLHAARAAVGDDARFQFVHAFAEELPFVQGSFDLVVIATSFDHWRDQHRGLCECARVLSADRHLVITDLFALGLAPTLLVARRSRARTVGKATRLLNGAGFSELSWHRTYGTGIIKTVVAGR